MGLSSGQRVLSRRGSGPGNHPGPRRITGGGGLTGGGSARFRAGITFFVGGDPAATDSGRDRGRRVWRGSGPCTPAPAGGGAGRALPVGSGGRPPPLEVAAWSGKQAARGP